MPDTNRCLSLKLDHSLSMLSSSIIGSGNEQGSLQFDAGQSLQSPDDQQSSPQTICINRVQCMVQNFEDVQTLRSEHLLASCKFGFASRIELSALQSSSNGISSQTPTREMLNGGHHGQLFKSQSQSSSTQVSPSSTPRIKSKKDYDGLMRAGLQQAKQQQSHQQKTQRPQSFLERLKSADEGSYHQA
ncbi:hypothetical protein MP228_005324 [Amoeboaphelidium protococcarum]|nr:hypothetical protein MP228_005324 [Amoeboaphelidium protococcarum]